MLKQRHSTSALSSKTLSRPKFINNKTVQQPHNISTQSGKQSRTLRNQSRNKSCLIPKHLAQSTQSHLVCSNERGSQKYKSTAKNYSTQNFNPNVSHNVSGNNMVQSKMTLINDRQHQNKEIFTGQNKQMFSGTLNPVPGSNMIYSYQPYLSLQQGEHNSKPRLSHNNAHLPQKITNQNPHNHFPINHTISSLPQNTTNQLIKQKLVQKQVKQMFLYKNKQLTKVLQEMHRFCISVKQLKWICQEVCLLIKKYNQDMKVYYQEYFGEFKPKTDLQNISHQAEELMKRFNDLAYLNSSQQHQSLFNFNLLLNNNNLSANPNSNQVNNSIFTQNQQNYQYLKNKNLTNQQSNQSPSSSSPQNPHSWSKLIANLQQEQLPKQFPSQNQPAVIPSEQNSKHFTIRTFQITQNNSPFKNKTLNQLIRLSQLRKTQFDTQNKENSQLYANNKNFIAQHDQNNKNRFTKKQVSSYLQSKQMSSQKDPFDSIHLPYFSTKPINDQIKPINDQRVTKQNHKSLKFKQNERAFNQTQKLYYQQEISLLKKQVQNLDKQNNDYFRKLRQRNQQLQKDNQKIKDKMTINEDKFNHFQRQVYILVERALNELLNCGKVNSNDGMIRNDQYMMNQKGLTKNGLNKNGLSKNGLTKNGLSKNGLTKNGYESFEISDIVKTRPIPKSQPYMMIGNKSFFQLINCLQQVFRLHQSLTPQHIKTHNDVNSYKSMQDMQARRNDIKTQRTGSRNHKQPQMINKQQQMTYKQQQMTYKQQQMTYKQQKSHIAQMNQQIQQLQRIKTLLQKEILKLQAQFDSYNQKFDYQKSSNNYDLAQMIFAQAFTIEEILQLNDVSHQQSDTNTY